LGEIVAHVLPLSSFDDIIRNYGLICGVDGYEEFKKRELALCGTDTTVKVKDLFDEIKEPLDYVFRVRHIVCHECASDEVIDESKLIIGLRCCFSTLHTFSVMTYKN